MKRILFILCFFALCSNAAYSQFNKNKHLNLPHYDYGRRWRFGFSLGLNVFDFSSVSTLKAAQINGVMHKMRAEVSSQSVGFDVNAIADYRINSQFNFRVLPGVCFGSRKLDFFDDDSGELLQTMDMASDYLELPVQLKYSAVRHSNVRPYIFAGANLRYNLTNSGDDQKGVFFGLQKMEAFGELGFGFDFYFSFFKFSIEAKFSTGLSNTIIKNPVEGYEMYRDAIDKLRSNIFSIKLHFE